MKTKEKIEQLEKSIMDKDRRLSLIEEKHKHKEHIIRMFNFTASILFVYTIAGIILFFTFNGASFISSLWKIFSGYGFSMLFFETILFIIIFSLPDPELDERWEDSVSDFFIINFIVLCGSIFLFIIVFFGLIW